MADDTVSSAGADLSGVMDGLQTRTENLTVGAGSFARAMSRAFTQSATGGKQLDDVLKTLTLRVSGLAVSQAFKPLASGITSGLGQLIGGLFTSGNGSSASVVQHAMGAIKPFAAGGVVGAPTYFPLSTGGLGLAGEAGPEAILPLTRGADGSLGVAASGGGGANITIQIATPDLDSFRRSETYLTGQIARAVSRGQRSL
jgi:lambda family phage tail tape measure protein